MWGHLGRFPDGGSAGIVSEGCWAEPVDPQGLPTLRSVFISMFSPLRLFLSLACVAWTQGMFVGPVCVWGVPSTGSGKFLFQAGLIQQSLTSAFPIFLKARLVLQGLE